MGSFQRRACRGGFPFRCVGRVVGRLVRGRVREGLVGKGIVLEVWRGVGGRRALVVAAVVEVVGRASARRR